MTEFMKILLSLSLSGTLLMFLVLLPRPLYRERFSRRWQYYIWLVVALRFVLPFTLDDTFIGYLFAGTETVTLPNISENTPLPGTPDTISETENGVPALNRYPENSSSYTQSSGHAINGTDRNRSFSESSTAAGKSYTQVSDSETVESENANPASEAQTDYFTADTIPFPGSLTRYLPPPGTCLFGIWLTIALILLIRKITVYQSFLSFLKTGSTQVADIEILNLLAECQERLDISGRVELCTNSMVTSPVMIGFFRPCIVLPEEEKPKTQTPCDSLYKALEQTRSKRNEGKQGISMNKVLSHESLYFIFAHELIHYKRKDMFCKWFVQLVLCVHWFNPFVYLLAREMSKACELACDEAVTGSLDTAGKRAYGNTLLAFLRTDNTCRSPMPYVTLTEGAEDLKERLGAIMKSHKKSKCITYITAVVTLIICISFTTLGAYAKSGSNNLSKNTSPKTFSSQEPNNISSDNTGGSTDSNSETDNSSSLSVSACEYDNGVYYIYIDGADESNKPLTGFTEGTIGVVLVQKESYTSLGPFDTADADSFREQLTRACEDMVKSSKLTRENADIILAFAEDIIQKEKLPTSSASGITFGYTFVNRSYYQDSYIIEMGWNLSGGRQMSSQAKRVPVPLEDGSEIGVYFADSAGDYAEDTDALKAIGSLIVFLRQENLKEYPDLKTPLVSRIRKVDSDDLAALAKDYLEENDLTGFSAVFPALKTSEQQELCRTLYEDSNTAFFVSVLPFMEDDLLFSILDRAEQDENNAFFFGIIGQMSSAQISAYMKKCYEDKSMSVFSILIDHLKEEQQRLWLEMLKEEESADSSNLISRKPNLSIIHENAEIRFYDNGSPYLHDILTNYTDQTITETEYCMLAYDADGQPLKLKWNFMDSSAEPAYSHLVRTGGLNLLPGQSEDYRGGWSLEDAAAAEMTYNILCLKTVIFEDGTVWNNPEYDSWYEAYAGKEIDADSLKAYYPHTYAVEP